MVLQAIRYSPATASSAASLEILDQLSLPHRSAYIAIRSCQDGWTAIKEMKVRGAPAIAIVAALSLAVELSGRLRMVATAAAAAAEAEAEEDKEESDEVELETPRSTKEFILKKLAFLKSSRPTAVNLGDAVGKLGVVVERAGRSRRASRDTVATAYVDAAERMLVQDVEDNVNIGRYGAEWIKWNTKAGAAGRSGGKLKVVTHCNTGSLATAGYGTALGIIRSLHKQNMLTRAFCTETRPYNQGSRLTAYELLHDRMPATLITDSMVASLLAKEGSSVAAIVVGADRVAANGDTANKVGTYALAVLAKYHGVKFVVAAPRTTIDLATSSGKDIVVEERPSEELTRIKGPRIDGQGHLLGDEEPVLISIAPAGIEAWNPAFDVTPAALIDAVVTEVGVVERGQDETFDFTAIFESGLEG